MPISADNAEKLGQFFIGSIAIFRKDRGCIPARTLATWSSIACQATQGNRFHVEGAVEPKTTFNTPLSLTAFWRSKPSSVYDANMTAADANRLFGGMLEHIAKPCAIAVFFVLVALLWTFLLQHAIAYPFVFLFFGAVMGSAWFGGFTSGFIAVVLSSVLIDYFFIPPLYSVSMAKESQSFFAAFVLSAIAITVVSSSRKRAENAIRNARDQLDAKVRERTAELQRSNLEIQESERQLRLLTKRANRKSMKARDFGRPDVRPCANRNRNTSDFSTSLSRNVEYPSCFCSASRNCFIIVSTCAAIACCARPVTGC